MLLVSAMACRLSAQLTMTAHAPCEECGASSPRFLPILDFDVSFGLQCDIAD